MNLVISIRKSVFLVELAKGAVGLHFGNDGIDKDKQVILALAHQHTDFSVCKRCV